MFNSNMSMEVAWKCRPVGTVRASKWFVTRMCSYMISHVTSNISMVLTKQADICVGEIYSLHRMTTFSVFDDNIVSI